MTLLSAAALQSPSSSRNAAITADLGTYATDYWPPHQVDLGLQPPSTVVSPMPVIEHPTVRSGALLRSYFEDFYYRVYITPTRLDLGNLVTAQTRSITVWNAWPDQSQSLTDLQMIGADGITATGEGALPLAFNPLQQRVWQVSVDTIGPAVIDATLSWLFAGLDPVEASITGNRLIAWMIAPDWANNLTESLAWLTDVQNAVDGSQMRQPCLPVPRREWEFTAIAEGADRRIVENALFDWSSRKWALPVWVDVTWLKSTIPAGTSVIAMDTTGLDFVEGGLVILYTSASSYELGEILTLTTASITLKQPTVNAWGKGARLLPCRTATLTDFPTLRRKSDQQIQTQVRFQAAEDCEWPAIAPAALYLGIPVLETRSNEPEDLAAAYGRQIVKIDNDIGAPTIDDFSDLTWPTQPFYWLVHGRADRAALRSLLYWFQGRGNALWLPSGNDDVTLLTTVASGATAITVAWAGITRHLHGQPGRRHLRIELKSGAVYYRRVTDSAEVDEETEQLAIDSVLGVTVTPAQVLKISWMMLATLNSDRVELGHVHESAGQATAAVTFIGVPKEEP
ncbi:hypothetical protein ACFPPA_05575 [Rhodanobacter ginsengisoli]|uniref:Phage tail protein n=1 Tax=Rhodanobacter ginsengisoli TaxID=418646 RepID=A0ABW0QKB0_9GAMM